MGLSQSRPNVEGDDTMRVSSDTTEEGAGLLNVAALSERKGQIAVNSRYIESRSVEDDYTIQERVVGCGASGPVKLATDRDGMQYAVKSFKLSSLPKRKRTELTREVSLCLLLDHPHVVRMERVYETDEEVHMVMEYMAGGELYSRLLKHEKYNEETTARTTRQMLLAVRYLHSNKVVHRDLKLENFLYARKEEEEQELGKSDHLKLIDFGFAKFWDSSRHQLLTQSCGTPAYVAPEVLKHNYNEKADLWSLGVIVYMLLTGRALFTGDNDKEVLKRVQRFQPHWSRTFFQPLSQEAKNFVQSLIVENPEKRLSAEGALAHPWLNSTHSQVHLHLHDDVLQSLRRFSRASHFRRACLSMMAWSLSCEDRQDLYRQFLSLDNTNKGTITLNEFKEVLEESYHTDSVEAEHIFEGLDLDGDQEISYREFLAAAMHDHVRMHNDVLLKAFRRFDTDDCGTITVDSLREVLGDSFEGTDVKDLLSEADFDHDGKVKYEDFLQYLQQYELEDEEDESDPSMLQPDMRTSITCSLADQAFAASRSEGHTSSDISPFSKRKHAWLEAMDKILDQINKTSQQDVEKRPLLRRRTYTTRETCTEEPDLDPDDEDGEDENEGRAKTCPAKVR